MRTNPKVERQLTASVHLLSDPCRTCQSLCGLEPGVFSFTRIVYYENGIIVGNIQVRYRSPRNI